MQDNFRCMKRIALIFVFLTVLSYQTSVFSQDDKDRKVKALTEEQIAPEMNVVNNKLTVKNAPVGKRVEVITIIGNRIREIQITTAPEFEYELNLPRAIYIFKLDGIVKKFIIK